MTRLKKYRPERIKSSEIGKLEELVKYLARRDDYRWMDFVVFFWEETHWRRYRIEEAFRARNGAYSARFTVLDKAGLINWDL